MPTKYLDEEGLSHVVRRAKETFAEKKELWNWQKTEKAGAVAFEPVPDSVLEPVVEFKFKETLPAEGEKGLDNPSTIEGVSNIIVGRRGKNLYNIVLTDCFGVTFSRDDDGTITINGTCTKSIGENVTFYTNTFGVRLPGTNLVSSIKHLGGSFTLPDGISCPIWVQLANVYPSIVHYRWMNDDGTDEGSIKAYGLDSTNTSTFDNSAFRVFGGVTYNNYKIRVQYELTNDSNPTEYEAPNINKYNLSLGSSYYGGSLDVNSGLLTVTWETKTLTGTEEWFIQSQVNDTDTFNTFQSQLNLPQKIMSSDPSSFSRFCSHFSYALNNVDHESYYSWGLATSILFRRFKSEFPTIESFKSWLASEYNTGHPVIIGYKLNSPYTIQLDPIQIKSLASLDKYEPRINTIYTDAESVEVGYQRFVDDENAVHRTGDENVEGYKIFSNSRVTDPQINPNDQVSSIGIKNDGLVKGVVPEHTRRLSLQLMDSTGSDINHSGRLASLEYQSPNENHAECRTYMRCWKYLSADDPHVSDGAEISVGYDDNGNTFASAPATSESRSNSTDIVTRGWCISDAEIDELSIS